MQNLRRNIRFYVLLISVLLSGAVFLWIKITIVGNQLQTVRLEQTYGIISLFYIYVTLLAGPLCFRFKQIPFKGQYLKARRALGVAAFYFAFLHTFISLFGQLGGLRGLGFLPSNFLFSIILGCIALFIFSLLAITSFDYAVEKLSFPKWKLLHRFVYFAGVLVLAHTALLGTHFSSLSDPLPQITFIALVFLLILEEPRFYNYLSNVMPRSIIPVLIRVLVGGAFIIGVIFYTVYEIINPFFSPSSSGLSLDIHAAHKQLAQEALQQSQNQFGNNPNLNNIPGLNGDRSKRYTVSMSTDPETPQPNQDVTIRFKIYDASTGNRVSILRLLYAKSMHLIVVNSDLTYFEHIHPTQDNQDFVITTQFPQNDLYHLYIQFQPFGAIEQQIAFTLPVGQVPDQLTFSKTQPDTDKTKKFGDYAVSVNTHGGLQAAAMSVGQQTITFTITDAKTGKPIKTLKPYLASFGHLSMIKQDSFDFMHVHPYNLTAPLPDANGGPTVNFLPIGIYGPFKPGIYRAFAEFNPDNKLFTADFTVKIN